MSGQLPTGTVTLLLADVEGSTRLWESDPNEMAAAVARLDRTVCDIVATRHGVRPVEQGEGDSFVVAFTLATDAVACALDLQRAPLAPVRLRIGVHTGEVRLRDEGNYIGSTVIRAARLRDLAHGGQTVLSGTSSDLVVDRLPAETWLTDLGTHRLRDLPRPERVVQLCHPDLRNEFPPLRTSNTLVAQHLPVQLTSFVGRGAQMIEVRRLLTDNRLVTLTGAGGAGKTRLAVQVAAQIADEFGDGVWYVDLAPITDPDVVPVVVARALSGRVHNYSDVIWSHTSMRLREMVPLTKGATCHEPARTASPWPKPSGQNSKPARVDIRHRIRKLCGPGSCSTRPKAWATTRSPHAWTRRGKSSPNGANASSTSVWPD